MCRRRTLCVTRVEVCVCVCVQQNVISPNAYTYCDTCDSNTNQVSGNVKSLALTGADGKPIDVTHSDHPFELWFDGK